MRRIDRGGCKNVNFQPFRSRATCRSEAFTAMRIVRAFGSVGLGVINSKRWAGRDMRRHVLVVVPAVSINFSLIYAPPRLASDQGSDCAPQDPPAHDRSGRYMGAEFGGSWSNGAMTVFGAASGHVYRRPRTRLRLAGQQLSARGRRRLDESVFDRPAALAADPAGTDTLPATKVVL
jgi:hypothetical protein